MPKLMSALVLAFAVALPGVVVASPDREAAAAALENGDYATAAKLYRVAAEAGDPAAQVTLAYMHWYGEERYGAAVPANAGLAIEWFARAADQGNAVASAMLALLFDDGGRASPPHAVAAKSPVSRRAAR